MIRSLLLASVAVTSLVSAAVAADLPSRKGPLVSAPSFTWTGCYAGGSAGIIGTSSKLTDIDGNFADNINGKTYKVSDTGGVVGLDVGCNYQMGALVLGLEGDFSLTNARGSLTYVGDGFYEYYKSKLDSFGTLRGRVGYAMDRALIYITGGLAYAKFKDSVTENQLRYDVSTSSFHAGYTLGAGFEYAFSDHWTARIEALYLNVGKKSAADPYGDRYSFKDEAVLARVGLNYKF